MLDLHKARSVADNLPLNTLNRVDLPVFNKTKLLLSINEATSMSRRRVRFEPHIYELKSPHIKAD